MMRLTCVVAVVLSLIDTGHHYTKIGLAIILASGLFGVIRWRQTIDPVFPNDPGHHILGYTALHGLAPGVLLAVVFLVGHAVVAFVRSKAT